MDLNVHFEKEAIHKKKILECDKANEALAFELFGKELKVRKLAKLKEGEGQGIIELKEEIKELKVSNLGFCRF